MRKSFRWFVVSVAAAGLALAGLPASATHNADVHSANLTLLANSAKTGATIVNSDIAFWGNRAYSGYLGASGSAGGFRILNIANPAAPTVVVDFPCAGSQNDISVWNNDTDAAADLLFLSVDTPMSNTTCTATQTRNTAGNFLADPAEWEGVRIFDINLETTPVLLANVPTDCGSHTHTLLPGKGANANKLYVYVASYPSSRSAVTTNLGTALTPSAGLRDNGTECVEPEPGVTGKIHNKVSIITVDLAAPAAADDPTGVAPNLSYAAVTEFTLDGGTRWSHRVGPTQGAAPVAQRAFDFTACHDISVFWEIDLAGGACWEEGQLWDVSNPTAPQILRRFRNNDVSDLFHSATFSWDGQIVAWEDEAGGGVDDRCRSVEDKQGRMYFYTVSGKFLSDFKIPRVQPEDEVCTAHNYNFVPQTNGRHILVSAWYEGGTSVIDLTQPTNPKEIGFYVAKTPPADTEVWSSYWYNGNIYANDERRGTDVFAFNDSRVDAAVTFPFLNAQTQMNLIPQVTPTCRGQAATIVGTSGADTLVGTAGADVIVGLGGADTLRGLGGGDRICGGAGKDRINGGAGRDLLSGNRGADRLSGGPGNDRLNGGPGRDRCNGGPGTDAVTRCEVIIG